MQQFSFIVEDLETAKDLVRRLWDEVGVRGEVALVPIGDAYKIDVIAEREVPETVLDQLPGKRA
ncbi:MAG: hypothetical protein K6U87_02635 [Firmicutes bacterium]|nr:hypothetical protein [Bacillota bacterium]